MKDSAGVKFNENTELIIEADPTGEVTSCRNIINGVEYVGGGGESDFSTAEVTFLDDTSGNYDPYSWGEDIIIIPNLQNDGIDAYTNPQSTGAKIIVPLYKNNLIIRSPREGGVLDVIVDATGNVNITYFDPDDHDRGIEQINVYGDCTLYLGYRL